MPETCNAQKLPQDRRAQDQGEAGGCPAKKSCAAHWTSRKYQRFG